MIYDNFFFLKKTFKKNTYLMKDSEGSVKVGSKGTLQGSKRMMEDIV